MKYNTKQVKKNFLKERLIGILVILILTLTMVPCFTSCSHGNNPEKSKPEVEDKNKKPDTPNPPPKPTEETPEQKIARILGSFAIEKSGAIPTIPDGMSSEVLEGQYAPLGLAYKEGDNSKVYLFAKSGKGFAYTHAELFDSLSILKDRIKTYKESGVYSDQPEISIDFPAHIRDVLEWRWKSLLKNKDSYIPSPDRTPWLKPIDISFVPGHDSKLKSMYTFKDIDLFFVVKPGSDPEVYFYSTSAAVAVYVDWEITFVEKTHNQKQIYSFHVGSYSVRLRKARNGKSVYFPPVDNNEPDCITADEIENLYKSDVIHMLKLSTLVKLALEKKLTDAGISADVAKQAVENYLNNEGKIFTNFNTWDVYLTPYRITEGPDENFPELDDRVYHVYGLWRNTFKITGTNADEFWNKCWKQP